MTVRSSLAPSTGGPDKILIYAADNRSTCHKSGGPDMIVVLHSRDGESQQTKKVGKGIMNAEHKRTKRMSGPVPTDGVP